MHDIAYILGLVCGLAVVAIICLVFRVRRVKHGGAKTVEYDERQMAARGKAYKAGFFTALLYHLIFAALSVTEIPFFQSVTGMLLGSFLGIGVFAVTAIRHDAYLGLNENKRSFLVLGIVVTAANLVTTVCNALDGTLVEEGKLTFDCLNPMVGILFAVIVIALVLHDRKVGKEEEEE